MTFGRRALSTLAAAALLGLAALGTTAAAQEPGAGPGSPTVQQSWALGPSGSADPSQPGNRQSLTYDAAPGSTIQDSVTLYNFGNVPLAFRVYATDAFNKPGGDVDLLEGKETPKDVGAWVTVGEERLSLPPGTQATIPITIRIPADATPGDHVGAVVASSPIPGRGPNGLTLEIDRRTGPDLRVRVQGPLDPEATIEGLSASYTPSVNPLDGSAEVTYRIRNTGNVRLKGTHYVTMGGPFGLGEVRTEPVEMNQLLPGATIEVTVPVSGVPASLLSTAAVHLDTVPIEGGETTEVESSSTTVLALPVSLVAGAIVVVLVLIAVGRYRRRGRSASNPPRPGSGGTGAPYATSAPSGGSGPDLVEARR